jgi:hypothetical protein
LLLRAGYVVDEYARRSDDILRPGRLRVASRRHAVESFSFSRVRSILESTRPDVHRARNTFPLVWRSPRKTRPFQISETSPTVRVPVLIWLANSTGVRSLIEP